MSVLERILRAGEGHKVRSLRAIVSEISQVEDMYRRMSDAELQGMTSLFRTRLERGEPIDDLLVDAFAVAREAADRVLGQRPYDVQLMGGAALHYGWVAEMRTGEGKTLAATLPSYLNGLTGRGVHVVTVNDYLARRDAEWMGRLHRWLGVSVGLIGSDEHDTATRRDNYACDITYGTNNEFGFDYLRDNLAEDASRIVQRGHEYCIIDEIDSILIDEARTPLVISGRVGRSGDMYRTFARIVATLQRGVDYLVEEDKRIVVPLEAGIHAVEDALGVENLYTSLDANMVHHFHAALKAKELYRRDKDYIVDHGEVKIVDEFTGRILEGRRWGEGVHQAVEARENVRVADEDRTLATVTLQNYFRLYSRLSGMTGTAATDAAELKNTYDLDVVAIDTHRPTIRRDHEDLIYVDNRSKLAAIGDDVAQRHERGQPILIGTASVASSEAVSRLLKTRGIRHHVLNAKNHTREAEIIAQAGRVGAVTVATNMAGRGVDILLGGNSDMLARAAVRRDGYRVDLLDGDGQLEGADEERAAALDCYTRHLTAYQAICSTEREDVLALGGLYVIGTERHESRRIDNQLRGRAGRQGDPGESRFYVGLDDDLVRLFAGSVSLTLAGKASHTGQVDSAAAVKAVERAQTTVERRNGEYRKDVLKYDKVLNEQRRVIYRKRRQILDGEDCSGSIYAYARDALSDTINLYIRDDISDEWELNSFIATINQYWPTDVAVNDLSRCETVTQVRQIVENDLASYWERREHTGSEHLRDVERYVTLRVLDQRWREHLEDMDYLLEGINLRAMGQIDPLVEWQREGYTMFADMMTGIEREVVQYAMRAGEPVIDEAPMPLQSVREHRGVEMSGYAVAALLGDDGEDIPIEPTPREPIRRGEKTPRNAPCPCGSGRKYKICHGA